MRKLVIIGAGGHARSVLDSITQAGEYEVVGFVDSFSAPIDDIPVIGSDDDLVAIRESGVDSAFIGIGYLGMGSRREELFHRLDSIGFELPAVIDATASVAQNAHVGRGAFIGKLAVVNSGASIGEMAIINSAAVVEHGCVVGEFSHVAVNSTLCGDVHVGKGCLIGAGSVVIQGIDIGDGVVVGANATVLANIENGMKTIGVYHGHR